MTISASRLRKLHERIGTIERAGTLRQPALRTGWSALDDWLPDGGFRPGGTVEWVAAGLGSGAMSLALAVGVRAVGPRRGVVIMDAIHQFHAPSLPGVCLDPRRTLIIRPEPARGPARCPRASREELWAWDQVLRSRGIGLVVGWLGRVDDHARRRLSLATEEGQTLGMMVRPLETRHEPSWADLRILVEPRPLGGDSPKAMGLEDPGGRRLRLTLTHARGGVSGRSIEVHWDEQQGALSLASRLGDSKAAGRALPA